MASYFAVNRKAVFNYFNPYKTEQFIENYVITAQSLRANDPYSIKCLRTIYLVLISQSIFQAYLYLFPFQWQHSMLFDLVHESNNFPSIFKLHLSAVFLMFAYIFHMLYVRVSAELVFKIAVDYYQDDKSFITVPLSTIMRILLLALNAYQLIMLVNGIITVIVHILGLAKKNYLKLNEIFSFAKLLPRVLFT